MSGSETRTDQAAYASLDLDSPMQTEHAQFRELDDTHGRWFGPDPHDGSYDWSSPQSFNRYSYVLNNPMSLFDPDGEDTSGPGLCYYTGSNCGGGGGGGGVGGGGIGIGQMQLWAAS